MIVRYEKRRGCVLEKNTVQVPWWQGIWMRLWFGILLRRL